MTADLTILYRGHLSSCNYSCGYCPFAKRHETASELMRDRVAVERFVDWCGRTNPRTLSVFFTPWGEALVRKWYQQAICRLSHLQHIQRLAVQTNLSCDLEWLDEVALRKLGLWCTFHPSQTAIEDFVSQTERLWERGVRHSVGMVGLPDDFEAIAQLRAALPEETYLWVNAWDVGGGEKYAYSKEQQAFLTAIDPLFATNLRNHPSRGRTCRTGSEVISVDGDGTVRRCHFVEAPLGNLFEQPTETLLQSKTCPNQECNCHIGYVHLETADLDPVFGDGILERVPMGRPLSLTH